MLRLTPPQVPQAGVWTTTGTMAVSIRPRDPPTSGKGVVAPRAERQPSPQMSPRLGIRSTLVDGSHGPSLVQLDTASTSSNGWVTFSGAHPERRRGFHRTAHFRTPSFQVYIPVLVDDRHWEARASAGVCIRPCKSRLVIIICWSMLNFQPHVA